MTGLRLRLLVCAAALAFAPRLPAADPFEFKDGDRVVLLGSTLVEREQNYGYWELLLTLRNADKNVTFRNLGWSGDTVFGESRNGFDQSPKGFERLVSLTKELKPTVVVVCYGHNESFGGPAGVPRFTAGLEKLLDAIAPTNARVVLMSPTPFGRGGPVKDVAPLNRRLKLYCDAIEATARKRDLQFVDLFGRSVDYFTDRDSPLLTDDNLHLTADGYRVTAELLASGKPLGRKSGDWYRRDNQVAALRAEIVEKNQLFFHRWRPQNQTYLFGFRKHEQGQNAKEVAEFDPLVAAAERKIADLKRGLAVP